MPNEKMENLLNLALAATPEEREKSLELDIGYDSAEQTWEVIVQRRSLRSCFLKISRRNIRGSD